MKALKLNTVDNIIYSKRKTLALEIRPNGEVWLRLPKRCPDRLIKNFLNERSAWIATKQSQAKLAYAKAQTDLKNSVYYFGEKYKLAAAKNAEGIFDTDLKVCTIPKSELPTFLRAEAEAKLLTRAQELAEKFSYFPESIKISNAKTRWGSCNSKKSVRLSWRLIMSPKFVQNYVICHELAHLKEMNHSPRFWALVAAMQPQIREAKSWLRAHQQELLSF